MTDEVEPTPLDLKNNKSRNGWVMTACLSNKLEIALKELEVILPDGLMS